MATPFRETRFVLMALNTGPFRVTESAIGNRLPVGSIVRLVRDEHAEASGHVVDLAFKVEGGNDIIIWSPEVRFFMGAGYSHLVVSEYGVYPVVLAPANSDTAAKFEAVVLEFQRDEPILDSTDRRGEH